MANDDSPRGLIPYNHDAGVGIKTHVYEAASSGAGGPIFIGQPVVLVAAGHVENAAPAGASGVATLYLGVAVGFLAENYGVPTVPFNDTGGTTKRYVIVADDPNQRFVAQEDTGGTALTLNERGASADLIFRAGASGNNTTGFANLEIDASTVLTTNSGAVTLLQLQDIVNSDGTQNAVGDFGKWIVRITNHQMRGQSMVNVNV